MLEFLVPIELPSLNRLLSVHWRVAHKIKKQQEQAVSFVLNEDATAIDYYRSAVAANEKVSIRLHRVGKRKLDGDNLQGAFKKVRDVVTRELHLKNDDDPRLDWIYTQSTAKTMFITVCIAKVDV